MNTIQVELGNRSYPIWVKPGLLSDLPDKLQIFNHGQQWVIITQPFLAGEYGSRLAEQLKANDFRVALLTIPKGEQAKALSRVESLYEDLLRMKCDRSTTILALGGGVVGDVAGFVAATFMRGIDYIQVPTTLLAMVDSSIGGKTGVNLPQGKNLVGAIYQPKAVAVDPHFLRSLPLRELVSGFAEVLKYGAIRDREFFHLLGKNMEILLSLGDDQMLEDAIARSCAIKAAIVSADEREGGMRRILNFGHTIGHALETTTGYNVLRHGEAIAFGMLCAGFISRNLGFIGSDEWERFRDTLYQLPLPELPSIDPEVVLETITLDKKVQAGTLHFVLLEEIGKAVVSTDVTEDDLLEALEIL